MLELLRYEDNQRNMQAGVVGPAFAARHARAVVGVVKDDGVVDEIRVGQFLESLARIGVGSAHAVVILRPILANGCSVGVVGRHAHAGWIGNGLVGAGADVTFVAAS